MGNKVAFKQGLRGALAAGRERKVSLQSRLSSSFPSPTPIPPETQESLSQARNEDDYAGDLRGRMVNRAHICSVDKD